MRSLILITLMAILISGCGGGDSSQNVVTSPPEPPQDGITGRLASGINGAQLTVHDASGEEIVLSSGRTTGPNGFYTLVFSEFEITNGINPPLIVTADASGATAICDYDQEGDNDCLTADGSFAAFGTSYILPDGHTLRGWTATFPAENSTGEDRIATVNISAASDLAARYALDNQSGTSLTTGEIDLASAQALGAVEFVTGLTTSANEMNDIAIADLTTAELPSTDSLAVALFTALIHGQVDVDLSNQANYRLALNRFENQVQPTADAVTAPASILSESMNAFVTTAARYQNTLASPTSVLAGAIASQTSNASLLAQSGGSPITIALPADPASSDPLDRTKVFTSRLNEAIGSTLLISQTDGFAGTSAGGATVFDEQLSLLESLVSREVRQSILQLDTALADALATENTELVGTNVSGALSFEGDVVTMATTTSTTTNIQTGVSVNLTITNGTRNNPGGVGTFNTTDIAISLSQTQNDLTTQELFTGQLVLEMSESGDATSLTYSGDLRSVSALEFMGDASITNLSTFEAPSIAGNYAATFTFDFGTQLVMSGSLDSAISSYTVINGTSSVISDLETNSVTDMNASLNLTVSNNTVTGGTFVAGEKTTGTLDANSTVQFIDDTATALPAPIL